MDRSKFINPWQVGGIEQYTIDNGAGRGVRVCEVNTGSGLRYRVLVDRGLDIDHAFMNQHSLAFLTHGGVTAPTRALDRGLDWLKSFPGGLLTSCGPFNSGGPSDDAGEALGLHGPHSNTPAEIESVMQPDPHSDAAEMVIAGSVNYGRMFGPNLSLRRTIRSPLGQPVIQIQDVFTNRGNTPATHAWLLHINFGYPLLDEGTRFITPGYTPQPRGDARSTAYFTGDAGSRFPAPSAEHAGTNEVFRYLTPSSQGPSTVAIFNDQLSLGVAIEYDTRQFPRLGQWMHWGQGEYVAALEPMTGGVEGRHVDRQRGWLRDIAPGQSIAYDYTLRVITQPPAGK
jgi:hypothetical protein